MPVYGDYVGQAIKEIQRFARNGIHLCVRFSGGKDSVVLKWLFDQAGIEYTARFSPTTVDPPEALDFVRKYHKDVLWDMPRIGMFPLIIKKGFPPTRMCRYCCREFKERNTCSKNAVTCTGVRQKESLKRANRRKYEICRLDAKVGFFNPIIDWTEEQVWAVIDDNHIPYCCTYDEGFTRLGCVGCPLTSSKQMIKEFRRWPKFENAYYLAFKHMLEGRHFDKWKTAADVMEWYIYGSEARYKQREAKGVEGQMGFPINQMYEDDSFGHPTCYQDWRDVADAKRILLNE